MPQKRGRRAGATVISSEVEALIEEYLRRYYLRRKRASLSRVVLEVRIACGELGLQAPTRRTIQRRLDTMDEREVMKAREGAKAARQRFAPVTGKTGPNYFWMSFRSTIRLQTSSLSTVLNANPSDP
ncbi:hypothetical protein N8E89_23300 (plasmid) [Phyllobacterium sp. A18/5-2]|uniref:DNA-binding domain-containing protein n=1 Tax=Phyllobacterium sp. A18/5-2 TaxID=2978392 RepID=UPI0021CAAAB1|nr:DNA-binding domain-containing protein [Phyllobacterium sp. A18/5-2]UXN66136.1 hypothetical protein N8E89_23300 [Phyllobacterium sp. A18/5-2]